MNKQDVLSFKAERVKIKTKRAVSTVKDKLEPSYQTKEQLEVAKGLFIQAAGTTAGCVFGSAAMKGALKIVGNVVNKK